MIQENGNTLSLLVHMAGSICLLLWGSHTVRSSVERVFSSTLNRLVARASGAPFKAVMGGAIAAILMQSATATALLATGLLSAGSLTLMVTMAIILGADLGSAIAARILYVDLSLLPSVLLVIGMVMNLSITQWRGKYFGRILIGLGLMLLSIQLMKQTITPLTASPIPAEWLLVMLSATWFSMLLVAAITWFAHSSVAIVLVIAALSQTGVFPPELFIPMLLGVNAGAGLIVLPMVGVENSEARSVVICNLVLRIFMAVVLFVTIPFWIDLVPRLSSEPGSQVVLLHIGFNFLLVILFTPISGLLAEKILKMLKQRQTRRSSILTVAAGTALDSSLLQNPEAALACARREAYRLGDTTEALLSHALEMFDVDDRSQIERIIATDREINTRNRAIHRYLSEVRRHIGDPALEERLDDVLQFASTMENIGDTVSHNLARLAEKRLDRGVAFSSEGVDEIHLIHAEVLTLLGSEINQFASNKPGKPKKTRKLVENIRILCDQSIASHRQRLSAHKTSSMGSSSIHQDLVRDLLQIALLLQKVPAR